MIDATGDEFVEHLAGIREELLNLKPSQQRYRPDVLMNEVEEVPLPSMLFAFSRMSTFDLDETLNLWIEYYERFEAEKVFKDHHAPFKVPYGPAFLVLLGWEGLTKDLNLHLHESPGIRFLMAITSSDERVLDHLSYDRCCLVRREVAHNLLTSKETVTRLSADPFREVREVASLQYEKSGSELFGSKGGYANNECVCDPEIGNPAFEDFFDEQGLEVPVITERDRNEMTQFSEWHWATQPFPEPMQDYMLTETVEYLKGPIHDQYSICHAGHGVNSYALNFRFALGDLVIFAQSSWGGVYDDKAQADAQWDELVQRLSSIMLKASVEGFDSAYVRKYLIVYSPFRLEGDLEFWVNENGKWKLHKNLDSLDAVAEFLDERYSE